MLDEEGGRRLARTEHGMSDEPAEEREFVVTPPTSVSASAAASLSSASARVAPPAISLAIIGS